MRDYLFCSLLLVMGLGFSSLAAAPISYSTLGSTYTQDFDSLANTGASNSWTNESTIAGWSLFRQPAPGTAITAYGGDNGVSNAGNFYSYGPTGSNERALGGLGSGGAYFGSPASGAIAGWIAVAFSNATGADINQVNLRYDGEQWRNGGNTTAQAMVMEYGFGAGFTAVVAWTAAGAAFDFTSPVATAVAAAVDGNAAGLVANIGGSFTLGSSWANGSDLWIRWVERNDVGNDHGLALDNFSLTSADAAVPEPGTLLTAGLALLAAIGLRGRRLLTNASR